jgi:nuclear cap-binding protein subunit 1
MHTKECYASKKVIFIKHGFHFVCRRKMNKHVTKLSKEANEARRMLEDSESDSDDSDDTAGVDKKRSAGGRSGGRGGEKPSEDHVEKLEEKLEAAQADQKNLFLIIFQV